MALKYIADIIRQAKQIPKIKEEQTALLYRDIKMTLNLISTEQCINSLQNYATAKVRSWNPFKLFRKRNLNNHSTAGELAKILGQSLLSDADLLKLAKAIDSFEDAQLQHDLLCFMHSKLNDNPGSFLTKRENKNQINKILQDLLDRRYSPWWTLFLIELPYYSTTFRNNLKWMIENISNLFTNRRTEAKQHLINVYSNEEIVNQIIDKYQRSNTPKELDQQKELSKVLDIALDQTIEQGRKELIKEIQQNLVKEIPFGQVLISAAVLSSIINSYLSKKENETKSKQEQAQEILYIVGKIFLKTNATQIAKSFIPGFNELIEAVVSVITSNSSINPLDADQKIGRAVASVTGGAFGGAVGSVVPFIGPYIGAYVGAVVSKTAATRFYQVLEAWQKAPRGPESIIPLYARSYFALIDNDARNILDPLYKNYLETENKSKVLGDEIAKWLCIYTLIKNSSDKTSEEYLEIINEEINRLKSEFTQLKDSHSKISVFLYSKTADNPLRVMEYQSKVKECLIPLHQPIISMLNEYFSPALKAVLVPAADSNASMEKELPLIVAHNGLNRSLTFFDYKIKDFSIVEKYGPSEELNAIGPLTP